MNDEEPRYQQGRWQQELRRLLIRVQPEGNRATCLTFTRLTTCDSMRDRHNSREALRAHRFSRPASRPESEGYTRLRPKGASNRALVWVAMGAIVLLGLLIHRAKEGATPFHAGHDPEVARSAEGAPAARPPPETRRGPQGPEPASRPSSMLPPNAQRVLKCESPTGMATYSDTHCAVGSRTSEIQVTPDANLADGMSAEDRVASLRQNRALAQATLEHEMRVAQAQIDGSESRCIYLASLVDSLDAQARQPQPAPMQDRIRDQRRRARDRQFALRCQ